MIALFVGVITIILGLTYYVFQRSNLHWLKLPPAPFGLPVVGHLPFINFANPGITHKRFAKRFGPIYRILLGPIQLVMLCDPTLIKEAFSQNVFLGRPQFWNVEQRSKVNKGTSGIVFAEGEMWKEHRRFILQTFRDFGVGKLGMEEKIIAEAHELVRAFQDYKEQPFENKIPLGTAVANVIASVLTGARYEATDPAFITFMGHVKESFHFDFTKTVLTVFPWTRFLPPMRKTYKEFMATLHGLRDFLQHVCEEHVQNWTPDRNSDFLDYYLSAVKSGNYKSFSYDQVPLLLEDLFEAGYETTTTTLRWGFLMMCLHPDAQKLVQDELDANVPEDVIPKPSDNYHLPYVQATIQEIHRYGSVVPMGVYHRALENAKLGSYDIPKGTWVTSNIRYVHRNDDWWENPEEFDPSRFMTSHGTLKEFSEFLIPFSLGKRRCPGEALARAEIYILLIAVLQKFELRLAGDPSTVDLEPVNGITSDAKPYKMICVPRVSRQKIN